MAIRNRWETQEEQACGSCEGPREFWGLAFGFRLYRCLTCRVVHYVEREGFMRPPSAEPGESSPARAAGGGGEPRRPSLAAPH